ncbi:MAG TPA: IS110 family transposase [Nitrospiraceae bacterium]|nr:IS110 family transposase [Nitrospiraceae bacterium]
MKKNTKAMGWQQEEGVVIGMDLGDKESQLCVLGADNEIRQEVRVRTTTPALQAWFGGIKTGALVVMEAGSHSPWISRLLEAMGHGVVVADPRRLRLISESDRKSDPEDARMLARVAAAMPELLKVVKHRSAEAQKDLTVIRARARLVEARTKLWCSLRGLAKSLGCRLPRRVVEETLSELTILEPLWKALDDVRQRIGEYDRQIAELEKKYPEVARLQQIAGVGPLISLTFVLTLDDHLRFRKSRQIGSYLGLRPKQRDSGESQPQLRITKAGDKYLRSLLIQGAQYILGRFGPDTDLKRWGLKLAARGGKNAKKRAVVAVARKLAVLLHRLWCAGSDYQPLRHSQAVMAAQ